MSRRARGQGGFTLIELLASISILGIIMGAVTGALMAFLSNGAYTVERDDHSSGAGLLTSYLNRDFASADSMTTGGTPCSGTGTNAFTLTWTEWTATVAQPSPAPNGGTWSVSYAVSTDPEPPAGGGTRYQLERWHCPPTGAASFTTVVRNLLAADASQAVRVPALASNTECVAPSKGVEVLLPAYGSDTADQRYQFTGCIGGRSS